MEALTQRLPAREGLAEPVLETVPAPFMGIAHCCLRRDPQRRCAAADIAARLRSNSASPISKAISRAQGPSTVRIPAASAKWRYVLAIAVLALAAAAVLIGPKLVNSHSEVQPAATAVPQQTQTSATSSMSSSGITTGNPKAPANLASTPATAKPSARKPAHQNPVASNQPAEPVHPQATPNAVDASAASPGQGPVVQQIMPAVSKSARDTIHGTIKVRVKVSVDPSGNVQTASFVSPGPSKYFARQAMAAAQQWKFVPGQGQDPRSWIVQFGFKRSGTEAAVQTE